MKLRNGFVSNSSSTAFMFITKTDSIDNLEDLIKENCKDHFELIGNVGYENGHALHITSDDIAEEVYLSYDSEGGGLHSYGQKKRFLSINSVIRYFKEQIAVCVEGKYNFVQEYISEYTTKLEIFESAKSAGFNFVIVIDFGNDGVVDSDLGVLMRAYAPKDLFTKKDLIICTEEWS